MKAALILDLVGLCRAGLCSVSLQGTQTGVVMNVTANRDQVTKQTSLFLDPNDKEIEAKIESAIQRVQ